MRPLDVPFDFEKPKRGARLGERKESRADVVQEPRFRRFLRAERAARSARIRLDDENAETLLRECGGGDESVRA